MTLYYHPLAAFCHKVLIALYENGTPFEAVSVDLGDPAASADFLDRWPVGKIPVLRDGARVGAQVGAMIEAQVGARQWAVGEDFSIADCAAAPGLFFAGVVQPFAVAHPNLGRYFERLVARPSVACTIREARPYFQMFPYREALPERFLPD